MDKYKNFNKSINCNNNFYDVVIVGSGIAGSVLAFELEKKNINYFICTDQKSPLQNTSSLSYGYCRIPQYNNLDRIIKRSVLQLGEDEKRIKFIYYRTKFVLDLFKELGIDFEYKNFGIIPLGKERGGNLILKKLQRFIPIVETKTELIDFTKKIEEFEIQFLKNNKTIQIKAKYLVLATGGYAGRFKYTDNFRYKNSHIFEIVTKNGGEVINLNCIFYHPFGYNRGKEILIGDEVKQGEFIDSNGRFVFNKKIRQLIKNNNYHEIFNQIVGQINFIKKKGFKIYFLNSKTRIKIEIFPTAHYTAGGIKTNYFGEVVGCKNLYAIGECKADGLKNGGRFPGYPFTSAIINGKFLAEIFKKTKQESF